MFYRYLSFLLVLVVLTACQTRQDTLVIISSITDVNGREIESACNIEINGDSYVWYPGQELILNIPVQKEAQLSLRLLEDHLNLVSPDVYTIIQNEGIELSLVVSVNDTSDSVVISEEFVMRPFTLADNEQVLLQTNITTEIEPGTLLINLSPAATQLTVISATNSEVLYTDSGQMQHRVDLKPGSYIWGAVNDNYESQNDRVQIESGQTVSLAISLSELIRMGSVSLQISPANATITVQNVTTNQTTSVDGTGLFDLPIGDYQLTASASGYEQYVTNFPVRENQETLVATNLVSIQVDQYISRVRGISNVREALLVFQTLPSSAITAVSMQQRVEYYSSMLTLARYLYNNGEVNNGLNVYRKIVNEDPGKIDARIELSRILILRREFQESRNVSRPIYGTLLNSVDNEDREVVALTARYLIAQSYYEEFNTISGTNISRRNEIGGQAYSSLQDFITRFESSRSNRKQSIRSMYNDAVNYRNIVGAELGL